MHEPIVSRILPANVAAAKEIEERIERQDMVVITSAKSFAEYNDTNL
jgi:hypothetical protein